MYVLYIMYVHVIVPSIVCPETKECSQDGT